MLSWNNISLSLMRHISISVRLISMALMIVIFVSSVGITVNAHYCSSSKTLMKSLISSGLQCKHETEKNGDCCENVSHKVKKSCCKPEPAIAQKHRCCTNFSKYFKVSVDVNLLKSDYKQIQFNSLIVNQITNISLIDNPDNYVKSEIPDIVHCLPSGKLLLTSLHQLKIDLNCA